MQGLVESLTGSGKPQQGAVMAKQLQPTMATSNPALSTTNLLHELDASAQEVIAKVAAAQVSALLLKIFSICHYTWRWSLIHSWPASG